jgi:hypothetical protein
MRLGAAWLALFACYSPHAREGAPCTDDTGCPTGQMCFAGSCTADPDPDCVCHDGMLACPDGDTACALGCLDTPMPHCGQLVPSNALSVGNGVVGAVTLDGDTIVDGDTGAITGGFTRAAGSGVDADVAYEVTNSIAVFSFHALSVPASATIRIAGTLPVAFVVASTASIDGTIDGGAGCGSGDRSCPGPGGGAGATFADMAGGCGPGSAGETSAPAAAPDGGGGGGGGGGAGGAGGAVTLNTVVTAGGSGGAGCMAAALEPLVGGSGGGGGGPGASLTMPRGGGGGGAFQLSVGGDLTIGGVITMAGGGGDGGGSGTGSGGASAGAGGGAGGAILVEATAITITGALAANGGGGGGGGVNVQLGSDGESGRADATAAAGGSAAGTSGAGGAGGAGSADARPGTSVSGSLNGGGGGGAFGRIFVRAATIAADAATISPAAGSDAPRTR